MKCQKCKTEGAHFTGSSCEYGPDPSDAANTPENLPLGFAWLCDDCLSQIEYDPGPEVTIDEVYEFLYPKGGQ